MKRFTVLAVLFSIGAAAAWAFFQASPAHKSDNTPVLVYDATGEMLKAINTQDDVAAIPVTGVDRKIAPVYDATGAMLNAISPNKKVITVPAYDATGAMLDAINP